MREEATSRISELSRYFAGSETLTKFSVKKDENLTHWFAHIAEQIEQLERHAAFENDSATFLRVA